MSTTKPESNKKPEEPAKGVQCRACGCEHCPVYYTRHRKALTLRVRLCRNCGNRFQTVEHVR